MKSSIVRPIASLAFLIAASMLFASCSESIGQEAAAPVKVDMVKKVLVVKPETKELGVTLKEGVTLAPEEKSTITSEVTAQLIKWHVEENQLVEPGEVIATLDPIDYQINLEQARAGLAGLNAQYVSVEKDYKRLEALLESGSIPQSQFDNTKAQKTALEKQIESAAKSVNLLKRKLNKAQVRAPYGGVITSKIAPLGKYVMSTMPGGGDIASIEKIDRLKASLSISEMFYGDVDQGDQVNFYIPTLNETINANVASKGKSISASKTFSLISYIDNKKGKIPAGLYAVATIETEAKPRIIVPATAVKTVGNRLGEVYSVENGKIVAHSISIGHAFEDGLEIAGEIPETVIKDTSNIKIGETVEAIAN